MSWYQMKWDDDGYGEPDPPGFHYELDLTHSPLAYFYGLALSDGSIRHNSRNSGAMAIELRADDQSPLNYFWEAFPWQSRIAFRYRLSPFNGKEFRTAAYVTHALDLREQMMAQGFPVGRKSHICTPPSGSYDKRSFWRGFVDGDGSLGVTANNLPFLSLVTISANLADAWSDYVERVVGYRPAVGRNARDRAFNIVLSRHKAVQMVSHLYQADDICIPRKRLKADEIMAGDWQRDAPWRRRKKASAADVGETVGE